MKLYCFAFKPVSLCHGFCELNKHCIEFWSVLFLCVINTEISESMEVKIEAKKTIERMETGLSQQQPTVDKKYKVKIKAEITEEQHGCTVQITSFKFNAVQK